MQKFNIETRELNLDKETRVVSGYINVVDRHSNILTDKDGKKFIEKIMPKTFEKALAKAKSEGRTIPLMFRHREIITQDVELVEDSIGLKFSATIPDETVKIFDIENIKACSFGFKPLKEKVKGVTFGLYERIISELELLEVTLTNNQAYNGSLVECREGENDMTREEILKLIEELQTQLENIDGEKTPEIDSVEEIQLASDEEVRVDPVQEIAKQELEEEKIDIEEDKVENPVEVEIAKIDIAIAEAEILEKEKAKESVETEIEQKKLLAQKAKMKMQLELLKLR